MKSLAVLAVMTALIAIPTGTAAAGESEEQHRVCLVFPDSPNDRDPRGFCISQPLPV